MRGARKQPEHVTPATDGPSMTYTYETYTYERRRDPASGPFAWNGAGDGIRTHDLLHGKQML